MQFHAVFISCCKEFKDKLEAAGVAEILVADFPPERCFVGMAVIAGRLFDCGCYAGSVLHWGLRLGVRSCRGRRWKLRGKLRLAVGKMDRLGCLGIFRSIIWLRIVLEWL